MEEEIKVKKTKKMKKLERKITKLTEKNNVTPKKSIEKKITKLEKKKTRLEKWLKIKLPFRILIKGIATWLILGGICYGCSYVPVVKEVKMVAMAAIAYVAPEPVTKVLDVVTINVGANNDDFEWLKNRLKSYINGEVELENKDSNYGHWYISNGPDGLEYYIGENQVSEAEYREFQEKLDKKNQEQQAKADKLTQDILGTTSTDELQAMSIAEILVKVATNSTPELVSTIIDMTDLTEEGKEIAKQDLNKALKILKKLNNNQMNELVEIITNANNAIMDEAQRASDEYKATMEEEQRKLEEMQKQLAQ